MNSPRLTRRQGLSRNQKPSGLLQTIKGRREEGHDLTDTEPSTSMTLNRDEEDAEWVTRPPSASSDSEEDRHRTADIVPTKFGKESNLNIPSSGNAKKPLVRSKEPRPKDTSLEGQTQQDAPPSSAGPKRSAGGMPQSHLTDETGFIRKSKKVKVTFGKTPHRTTSKATKEAPNTRDTSPATRFKIPEPIGTPSPAKPVGRIKVLRQRSSTASPSSSPAKRKFTKNVVLEDTPEKAQRQFIMPEMESPDVSPVAKRPTRARSAKTASKNGRGSSEGVGDEDKSPPRKFKAHFLEDLEDLKDVPDDDTRPILSTQQVGRILDPADAGLNSDSDLSSLDDEMFPKEPRCPMCHSLVDPDLLRQHTANGRMNVKKQTTFCRLHKRREAEDAQKTKGYPKVDWDRLETRFRKHDGLIKGILEGHHSSHYADVLGEHVEAGENRTLLRTDENLIPGYYGPRGLRVMAEYITKTFSDTARKRAIEDRLISSRGYSGYVQAVLVPELAVRLIMEDMSVAEEDARKIMSESSDVGELVHEETKDVVRWSDDEEN
ncbi:putative Restriction of telomere capping protein 4 [Seiridium cardinale]|uniref:Restriction of telomere capping protein 4 n=1 Tax=Seiridium cardinale TaxID=138064 RepID=A0ABR2XQ26_9PEZI